LMHEHLSLSWQKSYWTLEIVAISLVGVTEELEVALTTRVAGSAVVA